MRRNETISVGGTRIWLGVIKLGKPLSVPYVTSQRADVKNSIFLVHKHKKQRRDLAHFRKKCTDRLEANIAVGKLIVTT